MFLKLYVTASVTLAILISGCNETEGFNAAVQTAPVTVYPPIKSAAANAAETETSTVNSTAEPLADTELDGQRRIEVTLPSSEIRSGKKTLQAKASISGSGSTAITWKIVGPEGIDLGTIDSKGIYTSPADESIKASIQIVATLVDDPTITDRKALNLVPVQQLFVGCSKGNEVFPISGDIYSLAVNTRSLPDFAAIAESKKERICLDKYDIPNQDWSKGFPASPLMVEWFALHSTANLVIPSEGDYAFQLGADDGAKFYIDDKIIVDNDGQHSFRNVSATTHLTAGKHKIVVDWYQGPRDRLGLQLFWKVPGATDFVVIPNSAFATTVSEE